MEKNPHPLPDLFYCCLKNSLKLSKQWLFTLDLYLLILSNFIITSKKYFCCRLYCYNTSNKVQGLTLYWLLKNVMQIHGLCSVLEDQIIAALT